jgi:hypothetical protein
MVDKEGMPTREWTKQFQAWMTQVNASLTEFGEILAATKIQGRTEGIGTTVSKVDSAGIVIAAGVDFTRAYTNKNLDNIPDTASFEKTTPNEATGAGRAYTALDSNNRLAGAFRNNPVNVAGAFTGANPLTQVGVTTAIAIAANTIQFGDGQVSYNSGSVDPGVMGTNYVYADDPTFAGGAVTYQFTTSAATLNAANGRVSFGVITTVGGGGGAGGGGGGPCPLSGAPVKLYGDPAWWTMRVVPHEDFIEIETETGRKGTFTPDDRRYCRRGLLAMTELTLGDWMLTEDGEERLREMAALHLPGATADSYEATQGHVNSAWGFIGHNMKEP